MNMMSRTPSGERVTVKGAGGFFYLISLLLILCFSVTSARVFAHSISITAAQIVGVRVARFPDKLRVIIDSNGALHPVFYRDHSGQKLQIKFVSATLNTKIEFTPDPQSLVQSMRGYNSNNSVELILQGHMPLAYKSFSVVHPDRFIIDLSVDHAFRATKPQPGPASTLTPSRATKHVAPNQVKSHVTSEPKANRPPNTISKYEVYDADDESIYQQDQAPVPASSRPIVIVIDPGHGGKDPGAIGWHGVREKDVVLQIARYLQYYLNKQKGFKAVLTRRGDYFIPLRQRLNIAHKNKADMFLAIHADAYKYRNSRGASIFALSQRGATSEAARWLAEKENQSELGQVISDKDAILKSVLLELAQTNTISASLEIGNSLLHKLGKITYLHHRNVEQAAFVVLKSPDIPSLLVESGFISDAFEEARLAQSSYQQYLAYTLAEGLVGYFTNHRR